MPRFLYLSPIGKKVNLPDLSSIAGSRVYNMDPIRQTIATGLRTLLGGSEVIEVADLVHKGTPISEILAQPFDAALCDLTTCNPNIMYLAGLVEALRKPVLYFKASEVDYPMVIESRHVLSYSQGTITKQFQSTLHRLLERALVDPSILSTFEPPKSRTRVFISYSHVDRPFLDRMLVHLKPLTRQEILDVWVDTKLKTGDKWQEQIQFALSSAGAAILMVSADFLASDFIVENELPPLLAKAEVNGTKILPVILSPCRYARDPNLSQFQSANPPSQPLSSLSLVEREAVYDSLAHEIEKIVQRV